MQLITIMIKFVVDAYVQKIQLKMLELDWIRSGSGVDGIVRESAAD